MVDIPIPKLVKVSSLVVDGVNPNVLGEEQFIALKKNIERFGFLVPIITNEDLLVADGEHRLKAAKELGLEQVPTIVLPLKEVDRKILRQVLNKLRGTHDFDLDVREFSLLKEEDGLAQLSELLAVQESFFDDLLLSKSQEVADVLERSLDDDVSDEKMNSYLYGNVRQIVLYFGVEEYDVVQDRLEFLRAFYGIENTTELLTKIIEDKYNENFTG